MFKKKKETYLDLRSRYVIRIVEKLRMMLSSKMQPRYIRSSFLPPDSVQQRTCSYNLKCYLTPCERSNRTKNISFSLFFL